jgi:hypothetical protein
MGGCTKSIVLEHASYLVSTSALKNFFGSSALEHKGAGATFVPALRTTFSFPQSRASFSIGRTQDHTTREQEQPQERLAGLGRKALG